MPQEYVATIVSSFLAQGIASFINEIRFDSPHIGAITGTGNDYRGMVSLKDMVLPALPLILRTRQTAPAVDDLCTLTIPLVGKLTQKMAIAGLVKVVSGADGGAEIRFYTNYEGYEHYQGLRICPVNAQVYLYNSLDAWQDVSMVAYGQAEDQWIPYYLSWDFSTKKYLSLILNGQPYDVSAISYGNLLTGVGSIFFNVLLRSWSVGGIATEVRFLAPTIIQL